MIDRRPSFHISPKELVLKAAQVGTAVLSVVAQINALAPSIAHADGGPDKNSTVPVSLDSQGKIMLQPISHLRWILPGENVWDIGKEEVLEAEQTTHFKLSPERRLEAINFIKNLSVARSRSDLNLLQPRDVAAMPVKAVAYFVVENLALNLDDNSDVEERAIREGIDKIANSPVEADKNPELAIWIDQMNSLFSVKLTLRSELAGEVESSLVCQNGRVLGLEIQEAIPTRGRENIVGVLMDRVTGEKIIVSIGRIDGDLDRIGLFQSHVVAPGDQPDLMRSSFRLKPNGDYTLDFYNGDPADGKHPTVTTTVKTC